VAVLRSPILLPEEWFAIDLACQEAACYVSSLVRADLYRTVSLPAVYWLKASVDTSDIVTEITSSFSPPERYSLRDSRKGSKESEKNIEAVDPSKKRKVVVREMELGVLRSQVRIQ
jgi:hypothetical protein